MKAHNATFLEALRCHLKRTPGIHPGGQGAQGGGDGGGGVGVGGGGGGAGRLAEGAAAMAWCTRMRRGEGGKAIGWYALDPRALGTEGEKGREKARLGRYARLVDQVKRALVAAGRACDALGTVSLKRGGEGGHCPDGPERDAISSDLDAITTMAGNQLKKLRSL